MKKLFSISAIALLLLSSCKKDATTSPTTASSSKPTAASNRFYKNDLDILDKFDTRGIHSFEELKKLRADEKSPLNKLSEKSFENFSTNLLFYKDVVVSWGTFNLENELSQEECVLFFNQVLGMNPPTYLSIERKNDETFPIYDCMPRSIWDGVSPIEKKQNGCLFRDHCTCCWIRIPIIENITK